MEQIWLSLDVRSRLAPLLLAIGYRPCDPIAVAVSGGGDSLALLLLAHEAYPGRVIGLTVDHGLRAGSTDEARQVAAWAASCGIPHRILTWTGPKPATGIQARARAARYELLAEAARVLGARGQPAVLLVAHTREDQAETFAMRLAHDSDLTGLSAMRPVSEIAGAPPVVVLRPLLNVAREDLREYLRARGQAWLEDPSNQSLRFERIRVRRALAGHADLTPEALARAAGLFARLSDGLARVAEPFAARLARLQPEGFAVLDAGVLAEAPRVAAPILSRLLRAIGGGAFPPHRVSIDLVVQRLLQPGYRGGTLAGCRLVPGASAIWLLAREMRGARLAAPLPVEAGQTVLWDNRFWVARPQGAQGPLTIRPLGCAARALRQAIGHPIPAPAFATLPGLWSEDELVEPVVPGAPGAGATARFVGWERVQRRMFEAWETMPPADLTAKFAAMVS
jgi:tRNA(Ile)-lysidine synthase